MTRVMILLLVGVVFLAGCSGVIMDAKYSTLLDQSCAWSAEAAARADANTLSVDEMKQALNINSDIFRSFKDGRDGRETK